MKVGAEVGEETSKTAFRREVEEQGEALRRMILFYENEGAPLLKQWEEMYRCTDGVIVFSGMGTSYYAPLVIKPLLASKGVKAFILEAGELLHYGLQAISRDDLVILISQSGESIETCRAAEKLKNLCRIVAIVNNEESRLARYADLVLPLKAGEETSITSKTYTNTLGVLNIMGVVAVSGDLHEETDALLAASHHMDSFLQSRYEEIRLAEEHLKDAVTLHFLSRGPALAGAFQGALTFMEGARMTTLAMSCGSFRHGPFELVGEGHYAIVYIPSSKTKNLVERMVLEMAQKGSRILTFSSDSKLKKSPRILNITFKDVNDRHLLIAAATAQELLLDRIASRRGLTCGVFRHVSKITRRE
ncbi:SIS domain-containing protein [Candidatus Bathyarchaeota archaeon]|nr:MAG: SIS domain-containing protein [Candidatus Bathyarchaeota archaeon]